MYLRVIDSICSFLLIYFKGNSFLNESLKHIKYIQNMTNLKRLLYLLVKHIIRLNFNIQHHVYFI